MFCAGRLTVPRPVVEDTTLKSLAVRFIFDSAPAVTVNFVFYVVTPSEVLHRYENLLLYSSFQRVTGQSI